MSVQAEHEAGVTAIGLAPDGLTIAIGTENGVIGCLDVPTHQYRTLLRSHTDTVNAVAVDTHRCHLCCSPLCISCNLMQFAAILCCLHHCQAYELNDILAATLPDCASLSSILQTSESTCQTADVLVRGNAAFPPVSPMPEHMSARNDIK